MSALRHQIIGSAFLFFACMAQAQSVWHCSKQTDLSFVEVDQVQALASNDDMFQIATMGTNLNTIGISLRDLMDVYAGLPVRIGGKPLTACFNNDNHSPSAEALGTLGLNANTLTALSRKSSIVRSQLVWVSDEGDMMRCMGRHFPAVGYFNSVQDTSEIGPCF